MSSKRERSSSLDEEDSDEDRQPRDRRRSKSHEDSSSGRASEASSEQLKMLEVIRQKNLYVEVPESYFNRKPRWWGTVLRPLSTRAEFAKKRGNKEPPPERIDQPSTSGTLRSSETPKRSESRSSRPRQRASSIDDSISSSADWYRRSGKEIRTKPGANPETRRVRRRSPPPTRDKKDPSRYRSSKNYGSGVAHGSKQNISPGSQGHVASIPPQGNVQKGRDYPLHQPSWVPHLEASSSLKYSPQPYSKLPRTLPSSLPFASVPWSYDRSYARNQTTCAESYSRLNHATDQEFKSTAPRQNHSDMWRAKHTYSSRCLREIPMNENAALPVESSTATPITAPTTPQAEISSTSSSTEPTPVKPEASKVEFTSTSIKPEIEKPSEDSMIVASTTQTTVSDVMPTITTAAQTAASTSVTTTASNISEPKTSATSLLPIRQIDKSSDDKDCDE